MKLSHANCLEVEDGVYYNEETDFVFILENKRFTMGNHEGQAVSAYIYDVSSAEGVELGVMLPKFNPIRIGDL